MSVRKLKNSWWVDFQFNGIRYRKRSPINTESAAKEFEVHLRERILRGESMAKPMVMPTLAGFSAEWLETYVDTHDKPSTQRGHRSVMRVHLLPAFGAKKLDEIKAFDIERFQSRQLKQGLSAKTVNNNVAVLMKCLRTAADWERIATPPRVRPLKTIPPRFDFLSPDESDQLLDAALSEPHWHSMILVALRTGLRLGELRALEWQDVNLESGMLTVRRSVAAGIVGTPKSGKIRHIPLTDEVRAALAARSKRSGGVWRGRNDAFHANDTVYGSLERITKRAGLRHVGWHTLRHTFASQMAASGVPIVAIKELLGHSDVNMTMRYSHLAPSTLRKAVAVLERRHGQEGGVSRLATVEAVHLLPEASVSSHESVATEISAEQRQ